MGTNSPPKARSDPNMPPFEVGSQPKHAPEFTLFYVTGEVGPLQPFRGQNMPFWPPRNWPMVRKGYLGHLPRGCWVLNSGFWTFTQFGSLEMFGGEIHSLTRWGGGWVAPCDACRNAEAEVTCPGCGGARYWTALTRQTTGSPDFSHLGKPPVALKPATSINKSNNTIQPQPLASLPRMEILFFFVHTVPSVGAGGAASVTTRSM